MSVVIIGGNSGIGQATSRAVACVVERYTPSLNECDVMYEDRVWHYFSDLVERTGDVEHLVFSAGVNWLDWIGKTAETRVQDIFDVNVLGFIRVLNALVSVQSAPARVVAVSSDAATRPLRTSIAYCASKAALDQAVRVGARELGPKGWRVNAVAPGMVEDTPMSDYIDRRVPKLRGWTPEKAREYEDSQSVLKRRVTKEEVAATITWLLFEAPDAINGAIIPVNGGR